jgi:hypothetical protein
VPTKRTRQTRPPGWRITPAAVEAFRTGDALALGRALGIRPWEVNPLDCDGPQPPEWSTPGAWHDAWGAAWELHQALEETCDGESDDD